MSLSYRIRMIRCCLICTAAAPGRPYRRRMSVRLGLRRLPGKDAAAAPAPQVPIGCFGPRSPLAPLRPRCPVCYPLTSAARRPCRSLRRPPPALSALLSAQRGRAAASLHLRPIISAAALRPSRPGLRNARPGVRSRPGLRGSYAH